MHRLRGLDWQGPQAAGRAPWAISLPGGSELKLESEQRGFEGGRPGIHTLSFPQKEAWGGSLGREGGMMELVFEGSLPPSPLKSEVTREGSDELEVMREQKAD